MNTKSRGTLAILLAALAGVAVVGLFVGALVWGSVAKEQPPDYQGYDLSRPWFDGKPWDWFLDMFNQPSIKPQEVGTVQQFPEGSVPRSGVEPFIPATALLNNQLLRDQIPTNPVEATPASIARGEALYAIYCAVCHGDQGQGNTPVVQRGMPAIPIKALVGIFSEPHLYNKILYGQPIMPAYGYQTTAQERWDMVNFLKSPRFGAGGSQ